MNVNMNMNNRISYQIGITFLILFMLISITSVINDINVFYEKKWHDLTIFFDIVASAYLIFLILLYFNYTKVRYYSFIYYLVFFSISIYLIIFGKNSLLTDEVVSEIPRTDSKYYFLNIINDNISICSILLGFLVLFLTTVDASITLLR